MLQQHYRRILRASIATCVLHSAKNNCSLATQQRLNSTSASAGVERNREEPVQPDTLRDALHVERPSVSKEGEGVKYDPWNVLGVKPEAPAHELRLRYHQLMRECHPAYVDDPQKADLNRWAEIDKAYNLIVGMPTLDHQYRRHITPGQRLYYRIFPEWVARNIDDKPRWFVWFRHRLSTTMFIVSCALFSYGIGRFVTLSPSMLPLIIGTMTSDLLLGTVTFPPLVILMLFKFIEMGQSEDMSWLQSPKSFLQRPIHY